MQLRSYSPARWLALVVLVTVAGFVAGHIATIHVATDLNLHTARINQLTAESARLSETRGLLHRMGMAVGAVFAGNQAGHFDQDRFDSGRQALVSLLKPSGPSGPSGPSDPDEATSQSVKDALAALDQTAGSLRAGDYAGARAHSSIAIVRQADAMIERAILATAAGVRVESQAIAETHRRLKALAPAYDGVAALFAFGLLALAWSASRQYLRLRDERERLAVMKAHELDMFAGRIAHDLKNPLSAIALRMSLNRRRFHGDEAGAEFDKLSANVARMNDMVEDLLAFARASGRPEAAAPSNVKSVIEGLMADFAPEASHEGIDLTMGTIPDVFVLCPPGALASIVGNLVRNALKYVVEQGDVEPRVRVHGRVQDGRVEIEVEDNGPGIVETARESIFEPFVRVGATRQPGIGLGLSTVKRLVEAYGGRVGVRSEIGRGSCFWVQLPTPDEDGQCAA